MPVDPRIIQALIGLGADLSAYGANTDKGFQPTNLNAATTQNITARNMLGLMKQALDPSNELNIKAGSKGLAINVPNAKAAKSALSEGGQTPNPNTPANPFAEAVAAAPNGTVSMVNPFTAAPMATAPTPAAAPTSVPTAPTINPFNFDNITPGMLAGLSPQDLATVFEMKNAQDQMKQKSYSDMVEALYKGRSATTAENVAAADIPYKGALTKEADARTKENTPSVEITVGERTMTVTPKDAIAWEKLKKETTPAEIKIYNYAQSQGYKGSIIDFKNTELTGHQKDYNAAVADGYTGKFNDWLQESIKNGSIKLGEKVEEKKTLSELGGQLYFNDPKWTDDVHKQAAAFDKDQAWLVPEKDRPLARSKVVVKAVEDKIAAGSGAIQSVVMDKDGRTMIWTVKWPSGDVKTIKQAVR